MAGRFRRSSSSVPVAAGALSSPTLRQRRDGLTATGVATPAVNKAAIKALRRGRCRVGRWRIRDDVTARLAGATSEQIY
jgi:hypothetical protein